MALAATRTRHDGSSDTLVRLTWTTSSSHSRLRRHILPPLAPCSFPTGRLSPGRAIPLPLQHDEVHRLPFLRGCLQRAERKPDRDSLAARRRDRRRRLSRYQPPLSLDGLQPLPRCRLPEGLPGRCLHQRSSDGHRDAFRRCLYRLPVLRVELPLLRSAIQC